MLNLFDIQRCCVHDGPGIRTTFFAKGCPLRCPWCHNPEGLSPAPQLRCLDEKCILCGTCAKLCPNRVHTVSPEGHQVDFSACTLCGKCLSHCPSHALTRCGFSLAPEEVLAEARRDAAFYGAEGGVTFSGGEAMLQAEALAECMRLLKGASIPACIDTSACVPWESFQLLLPLTQVFLCDVKCVDSRLHRQTVGADNGILLENIRRLSECGARLWIRVPVISGFNTEESEIRRIAGFLSSLPRLERVTLLPYHRLGREKYGQLGLSPTGSREPVSPETLRRFYECFQAHGVAVDRPTPALPL